MAKIALALAARGTDEAAFKAWGTRAVGASNTKQWGSGKELLTHLVDASQGGENCIERLYIFSHAWPYIPGGNRGGVKLGGIDVAGFYSQPSIYDDADARYINDFARLVQRGEITFCSSCKVIFTGCRVASSQFPVEFLYGSGCEVIASNGSSHPKPGTPPGDETGQWLSTAGGWTEQQAKKNENHYVGWINYSLKPNGEVEETRLGEEIRIW
uniref:hypothetical protein n=1 Tax=uncultured Allobacillus sp. TaxID=1638025 RepID=UPI00259387CD|nr:hypothetical protein [uncultured Allobacillus sp.]